MGLVVRVLRSFDGFPIERMKPGIKGPCPPFPFLASYQRRREAVAILAINDPPIGRRTLAFQGRVARFCAIYYTHKDIFPLMSCLEGQKTSEYCPFHAKRHPSPTPPAYRPGQGLGAPPLPASWSSEDALMQLYEETRKGKERIRPKLSSLPGSPTRTLENAGTGRFRPLLPPTPPAGSEVKAAGERQFLYIQVRTYCCTMFLLTSHSIYPRSIIGVTSSFCLIFSWRYPFPHCTILILV